MYKVYTHIYILTKMFRLQNWSSWPTKSIRTRAPTNSTRELYYIRVCYCTLYANRFGGALFKYICCANHTHVHICTNIRFALMHILVYCTHMCRRKINTFCLVSSNNRCRRCTARTVLWMDVGCARCGVLPRGQTIRVNYMRSNEHREPRPKHRAQSN